MKRALLGYVLSAVILTLGFAPAAAAHVFKSDNGVTVELHIPPADTPHTGEHTTLQFEFSNAAGNFSLAGYSPSVRITETGQEVAAVPIKATGKDSGTADVVFARPATYHLMVTGGETDGAPDFIVSYDVTVTAPLQTAAKKTAGAMPVATIAAAGGSIVLLAGVRVMLQRRKH